ncbi:MAG: hypothetical protein ACD_60C00057G0019 [uncultured bacterium]|nr:MAG: hypothetical protein ACD_60C00057G0019 [uncultured bacterium]
MSEPGNLYVISAPSGTGKTTLVKTLIESISGITVSISHTTRPKRSAEMEGINYYFVDKNEFSRMVKEGEFLEHAEVFHYCYGTSKKWVEHTLKRGLDVVLEIDWQGKQQIEQLFPDSISIFILPPSLLALSERLMQRNQDKSEIIQKRLADAKETISHSREYDYMVVNDDFQAALDDLRVIIGAERLRERRQSKKLAVLIAELMRSS